MRPSELLGLPATNPSALLIDLGVAHRASSWESEHGVGEYWWLSVLRALTGNGSKSGSDNAKAPQEIRWL